MAPARVTRSTHVEEIDTSNLTPAQLKELIDRGVADAMAARDAVRSRNNDDSHEHDSNRRTDRNVRGCTYPDFLKCKPLYFKGKEGVVELMQWFERMETVYRISNCANENRVKFATCTLLESALTWWNSLVATLGHDAAYALTWAGLKERMTEKYCPRGEMKKLESELWELKCKGNDVVTYNQRF